MKFLVGCILIFRRVPRFPWLERKLNGYFGLQMQIGSTRSTKVAGGLSIPHLHRCLSLIRHEAGSPKREVSLSPSCVIREILGYYLSSMAAIWRMRHALTPFQPPCTTSNIFKTLPRIVLRQLKYFAP